MPVGCELVRHGVWGWLCWLGVRRGEGLGRMTRLGCKRSLVFSDRTDGSRGEGVRIRQSTHAISPYHLITLQHKISIKKLRIVLLTLIF